jgi:glycosyltransferase involved in cell wall biosynthesis
LAIILFGGVVAFWIFQTFRVVFSALKLPWLQDFDPILDCAAPRVSLIFAARDEEEKLPAALETLAKIDYPELEIIGVDDRSEDATAGILDEFAARHARFRSIHVAELPDAWLGKPHALQKGYEAASGEWLLFTDADVRFQPDALRRAMAVALGRKLDHLSLLGQVDMVGFWETV